ncbi:OST-HTH/LOTUS domain-containing protein [Acidimangrovimonas pyrenivorans]|uniref:OST-HTH/LOTUS domain-containing protein n=1 Tax=Acidimangrovimonas pyrenivorans TaxID=2030798 RepID=A0ABV7AL55_9RHOB
MALKYNKPNAALRQELVSVSQAATEVISAINEQNFLPDDFPTASLIDICTTLSDLKNGTAEGCRAPLEYARGRVPAIRRNHFLVEDPNEAAGAPSGEPALLRGMSLDQRLSELIASITTALDEYRYQASEQNEEDLSNLRSVTVSSESEISRVVTDADKIEIMMRTAFEELDSISNADSQSADTLSRTLKDTEGLARVSKAELSFGVVVVRWYKNIVTAAKKMPKAIETAAKGVKVGVDIGQSFSARWMEMAGNLFDFGLNEIDRWADTAIEVCQKLQKRADGVGATIDETPQQDEKSPENVFDADNLYRDGYVSYVEKRGLYAFLLDVQSNRYFLRLENGHLRTGQPVELGAVAKFRYAENPRGKTAIEVSFYDNAVFSMSLGVLNLNHIKIDFGKQIREIAKSNSKNGSMSLYKLGAELSTEFKSTKELHEVLGYESLAALVNATDGLEVSGDSPNLWVNISGKEKIWTSEETFRKQKLSRDAFENWLKEALDKTASSQGLLLSRLGVEARQSFECDGKIPHALGFSSYIDLVKDIDGISVLGKPGGSQWVNYSKHIEEADFSGKSQEERVPLTLNNFENWTKALLAESNASQGILLSRIGAEARQHFDFDGRIPDSLGFRSYVELLNSIEGIDVVGESAGAQRVFRSSSVEKWQHPDIPTNKTDQINLEIFSTWLYSILSLPKYIDGILLSQLGHEARRHFEVSGKIPQILGFSNYIALIDVIDGVSITGSAPRQRVLAS